jgi:hypothetical protein
MESVEGRGITADLMIVMVKRSTSALAGFSVKELDFSRPRGYVQIEDPASHLRMTLKGTVK